MLEETADGIWAALLGIEAGPVSKTLSKLPTEVAKSVSVSDSVCALSKTSVLKLKVWFARIVGLILARWAVVQNTYYECTLTI